MTMMTDNQDLKTAVIMLQYGGPDSPEAVEPFLFNLFNDPNIIEAPTPIRWLIAKYASKKRAPIAREIYASMGGSSPILPNTIKQATSLDEILNGSQMGLGKVKTFVAMRYWNPMTDATAQMVKDYAPDRIVLLPMYPQYSRATTGSSVRVWDEAAKKIGLDIPTWTICCYPEDPGFVEAMASLTKDGLAKARSANKGEPRVLFSAHGLPERNIKKGDPYQMQIERSVEAIVKKMADKDMDWKVTFQSRVGPLKWIDPDTEVEIKQAGAEGKPVVVVPVAFVSEHSETLVELDIEYKEVAEEHGVPAYVRVPTVDARASFVNALADQVQQKLSAEPSYCSSNGGRICPNKWKRCPNQMPAPDA
ncbi:MAG: ferrochelatase [Alphaproteobacteria bacterium]